MGEMGVSSRCLGAIFSLVAYISSAQSHVSQPIATHFKIDHPDFESFKKGSSVNVFEKYGEYVGNLLFQLTPSEYWSHPEFGLLPFNTLCDSCIELIHLRDEDYRYYVSISHPKSRFYVQKANGPLHYKDEQGIWRTINWYLQPEEQGKYVSRQPEMYTIVQEEKTILKADNYFMELLNKPSVYLFTQENESIVDIYNRYSIYTIGSDGIYYKDVLRGLSVDKRIKISRLRVSIEYIFNKHITDVFPNISERDTLLLVDSFRISGLNINVPLGTIVSSFSLIPQVPGYADSIFLLPMWLLDKNGYPFYSPNYLVEYDSTTGILVLKIYIPVSELLKVEYPIVLDPIITVSTSNAATCGFGHDGNGGGSIYCPCAITLTGLGGTQLVNAIYNIRWESNCGVNCYQGSIIASTIHSYSQYHGWIKVYSYACNVEDPSGSLYWACGGECTGCGASCTSSCGNHTCGGCSGSPIAVPSFVTCLSPQCNDYTLTFESRNYHREVCNFTYILGVIDHYCGCMVPCDNSTGSCQTYELFMSPGWFSVTVEGRTVEATATANTDPDTLTITCGNTVDLCSNPQYGVPGYTIDWYMDGSTYIGAGTGSNGCILNYSPPLGLHMFHAVVTDACGNTFYDTVYVDNICIVAINNLTLTIALLEEQRAMLKWMYNGSEQIEYFEIWHGPSIDSLHFVNRLDIKPEGNIYRYELSKAEHDLEGYWQIRALTRDNNKITSNIVFLNLQDSRIPYGRVFARENKIIIEVTENPYGNNILQIAFPDGKVLYIDKIQNKRIEVPVPQPGIYIVQIDGYSVPVSIVDE